MSALSVIFLTASQEKISFNKTAFKMLIYQLILITFPLIVLGQTDLDFIPPWKNNQPPPGCYFIEGVAKCYRVSHTLTNSFFNAHAQCKSNNGRLAATMTDDVWNKIWDDLIVSKSFHEKWLWLGLQVPPHQTTLTDADGNAANVNAPSVWNKSKIGVGIPQDRCMWAHTRADKSLWGWALYGNCANQGANYNFLCEYNIQTCNMNELDAKIPKMKTSKENATQIVTGTTLDINCNPGFSIKGPSTVTCTNGQWSELPECVSVSCCPEPTKRIHAEVVSCGSSSNKKGDKVTYICNEGYFSDEDYSQSKTHFSITCKDNCEWSEPAANCVLPFSFTTTVINFDANSAKSISLNCDIDTNGLLRWYKNTDRIINPTKYDILRNGTLTIKSANAEDQDLYYCTKKSNGNEQPSNIFYQLTAREDCKRNISEYNATFTTAGSSVILDCKKMNPEDNHFFTWTKDGQKVNSTARHTVLPNGKLFISKVRVSDAGNYECTVAEKRNKGCVFTMKYKLAVTASARRICRDKFWKYEGKSINVASGHEPWLVTFWRSEDVKPFCYGIIIDSRWVLTSAYCLENFQQKVNPKFSMRSKYHGTSTVMKVGVQLIVSHPNYSRRLPISDIGLVKLVGPALYFNANFYPICISEVTNAFSEMPSKMNGTVVGLAETDGKGLNIKTELMEIESQDRCNSSSLNRFTRDMFCVKDISSVKSSSVGKFGSPFLILQDGMIYVMGIYSWGQRNVSDGGLYDYFVNVPFYHEWIQSVITNN